jgi:hypothetical protein
LEAVSRIVQGESSKLYPTQPIVNASLDLAEIVY